MEMGLHWGFTNTDCGDKLDSGTISFTSLFEYIKQHPEIPHKAEPAFSGFKHLYLKLVQHVADIPGWYAWVRAVDSRPRIIHIGQSQTRKTASLKARLTEEFLDEFVALWATVWNREEVVTTLDRKYAGKYAAPIKRAARKAGATHIVWFGKAGLTDEELNVVEHNLIAKYDPPGNKQSRNHATSFPELVAEAESALNAGVATLNA